MNDLAVIYPTNGGFVVVDADLYQTLNSFNWQRQKRGNAYRTSYANGKRETLAMHRVINGTPVGFDTDHINGFPCDNTRRNLRTATHANNIANATQKKKDPNAKTGSKFKGVTFRPDIKRKPWGVRIGARENRENIGYFATEIEAAAAYNKAALVKYGEFAKLNPL